MSQTTTAAASSYANRRAAHGIKRATFWIDTDTRERLAVLKARYGSKDAAIAAAVKVLSEAP